MLSLSEQATKLKTFFCHTAPEHTGFENLSVSVAVKVFVSPGRGVTCAALKGFGPNTHPMGYCEGSIGS